MMPMLNGGECINLQVLGFRAWKQCAKFENKNLKKVLANVLWKLYKSVSDFIGLYISVKKASKSWGVRFPQGS